MNRKRPLGHRSTVTEGQPASPAGALLGGVPDASVFFEPSDLPSDDAAGVEEVASLFAGDPTPERESVE